MRPGSMTEKWPGQSFLSEIPAANVAPTFGGGIAILNKTIPHAVGRPQLQASSPKSLSKVRSTRLSRTAHARTS